MIIELHTSHATNRGIIVLNAPRGILRMGIAALHRFYPDLWIRELSRDGAIVRTYADAIEFVTDELDSDRGKNN